MISPYLRIGLIARPHGVRGNVKINPATDDPARFKGLTQCYLELHGKHIPVRLSVVSAGEDMVLAHIEGYDTPEAAEKLRGTNLCVDRAHTVELKVDNEKAAQWIKNGAQPTDTVRDLLKKTGAID